MKLTKKILAEELLLAIPEVGTDLKAQKIISQVCESLADHMRAGHEIELRGLFTARVHTRKVPVGFAGDGHGYTEASRYRFTVSGQARH